MTPCCRVCGTELVGELVSCERCQTPHHKDCWEYWGRCATYGCASPEPRPEPRPAIAEEPMSLEVRSVADRPRYLPRRPLVEAHRTLLWSRDGAHVRLAPEEVALQLPPELALELPLSIHQGWERRASALFTAGFATATLLLSLFVSTGEIPRVGLAAAFCAFLLVIARLRIRRAVRTANRMWLVSSTRAELALEALLPGWLGWRDAVRVRLRLILPGTGGECLRATGVALRPAFGSGEEREVVKAYRLQLSCALPGGGIELVAPVAVPAKGEPRGDFLRELSRVRGLGMQIAALFHVPYAELRRP